MANCYSRNMFPIWCVCDNELTCCVGRHTPSKKCVCVTLYYFPNCKPGSSSEDVIGI
jgi:hypothetical protein